ncbi:MAG: hypothetical protein HY898_30605 [Deltaproteobacteria bacterium]|nr:hypothetical protein [Deltaproteobacteria bacterium]
MQSDASKGVSGCAPECPKTAPETNPIGPGPNVRASALRDLYAQAQALLEQGDLAAARVLHEAAGRLLGLGADAGEGAEVIALASERGRRDQK